MTSLPVLPTPQFINNDSDESTTSSSDGDVPGGFGMSETPPSSSSSSGEGNLPPYPPLPTQQPSQTQLPPPPQLPPSEMSTPTFPPVPSTLPSTSETGRVLPKEESNEAREAELTSFYKTLDTLPNGESGQKTYFLLVNKDDVRFSGGKPKFPEGTCFGTTYGNVADYASFFLWKKCPSALSVYEIAGATWKSKKEMFAFLRLNQKRIDCYLDVLSKCSRCPSSDTFCDFDAWDAYFHGKREGKPHFEKGKGEEECPNPRKYSKHRCKKECTNNSEEKKQHHETCPNKCHDHCYEKHSHHNHCEHDRKRYRKSRIYFSRRRCSNNTSETSGEPRYKYFICIKGNAGPLIEKEMKDAINVTEGFNVESYLELDKRACKTALCNNNRIAYAISHMCGLTISCAFEGRVKSSQQGSSSSCEKEQPYFPLITGCPSFVQFYNRTVGMSPSSSTTTTMTTKQGTTIDSQWLISYNEFLNGKESSGTNNGKVGIEIPSENKLVMVPVDKNLNALSFCVPPSVDSLNDIDSRRKEICAIHGSKQELEAYNAFIKRKDINNVGSLISTAGDVSTTTMMTRPKTLKVLELYEIS